MVGPICDISITGPTHVAQFITQGDEGPGETHRYTVQPEDLGLTRHASSAALVIRSPEDSAAKNRALILWGRDQTAARDVVLANAAAALWVGGIVEKLADGGPPGR